MEGYVRLQPTLGDTGSSGWKGRDYRRYWDRDMVGEISQSLDHVFIANLSELLLAFGQ